MSEMITLIVSAIALRVIAAGTRTALGILREVCSNQLSPAAQRAFETLTASTPTSSPTTIAPAQAVSSQALLPRVRTLGITGHDAKLVSDLVQAASLVVEDPERVRVRLLEAPPSRWTEILREEHDRAFRGQLLGAVERACRSCQFSTIRKGDDHLVAEDVGGRALAISIAADGTLRAEVLGVADGSCRALLDRFLEALRAEGVELSLKERRWTGGAPSTPAALNWVRKRVGKKSAPTAPGSSSRRDRKGSEEIRIKGGAS